MTLRILASVILLISVLFFPFWLSVILALAATVYFSYFLEAVALFLLSDLLYGVKETKFFDTVFVSFIVASILLVIIELVKKKLKFYP
ncbi:hypothetical protein A2814_03450 [Candidatus Nomurabacteria bacterium RIFCSPHIGHO2_01_FULL_38_19]|uniref:Uncharacterized protein n=1 Tax=Candidatus Nomurabacteria bacterium RIFCSPHIGHO2_01_FULL_38_19 TaxID=1801732 RepID=A0A1F6UTX8_9BACT|nr:MAG: hypothetical protein A2814_03450 [Candidatus Nomurabacteria bacterium RIFCSPHIGHO2_01_FULL_38_19]